MVCAENDTADRTAYSSAEGVQTALPLHFFVERYAKAYIAEMQAFVTCVQADTAPPVGGDDGRAPVVIAYAAGRSLREHRPVRTDEVDGA
jgi:myo-inositol 2-dehydrogenase/D-chiro-inositol 1-dehydrogenase